MSEDEFQPELNKELMIECFRLIDEELGKLGISGEIILTGGASMCLVHGAREATKDIDALYYPEKEMYGIALKITLLKNLPPGWLNNSVEVFMTKNPPQDLFLNFKNLKVATVTAEYLLAMKIMSSRARTHDLDDIKFLINKLNISSKQHVEKLLFKFFDKEKISDLSKYILNEVLSEIDSDNSETEIENQFRPK
jgi:hypothetical protein